MLCMLHVLLVIFILGPQPQKQSQEHAILVVEETSKSDKLAMSLKASAGTSLYHTH